MHEAYERHLSEREAERIAITVGQVFQPRTPISTRELFAGRWTQMTATVDAVNQVGLHVVIYGERGVGKTSLANIVRPILHVFDENESTDGEEGQRLVVKVNSHKDDSFSAVWRRAFDEVIWQDEAPRFGFARGTETGLTTLRQAFNLSDQLSIDDIRRTVARLPGAVFIFDEFDRIGERAANAFTDLIKVLSDFAVVATIILVGVSDTIDGLIRDHASIGRALIQVRMPRMKPDELRDILKKGENKLGVIFDDPAAERIVQTSQGLPHYTHLLGQYAVRQACERESNLIGSGDVQLSFEKATSEAQQSVKSQFATATHSAHKDALYADVLLACAMTAAASVGADAMGYFQASRVVEPLQRIMPQRSVGISLFNKHLAEFCDPKRGQVLERTGPPRGYRYRFRDPLLPPYIIMEALAHRRIELLQLDGLADSL